MEILQVFVQSMHRHEQVFSVQCEFIGVCVGRYIDEETRRDFELRVMMCWQMNVKWAESRCAEVN